jgi:hypothetical protein
LVTAQSSCCPRPHPGRNGSRAGNGPDQLNTPVQDTWLANGHVLITNQLNERIIEVNLAKRIVWQYGTTGVMGNGPEQLQPQQRGTAPQRPHPDLG